MPKDNKDFYLKLKIKEEDIPIVKEAVSMTFKQLREEGYVRRYEETQKNICFDVLAFGTFKVYISKDKKLTFAATSASAKINYSLFMRKHLKGLLSDRFYEAYVVNIKKVLRDKYSDDPMAPKEDEAISRFATIEQSRRFRPMLIAKIMHLKPYGKNTSEKIAAAKFAKDVWEALDQDVLNIVRKTNYYSSNAFYYNIISHNLNDAKTIFNTDAGLISFWVTAFMSFRIETNSYSTYLKNVLGYCNESRMNFRDADDFLELDFSVFSIENFKLLLACKDIYSKEMWKFMCRMSPYHAKTVANNIFVKYGLHNNGIEILKALVKVKEQPTYTLLKNITAQTHSHLFQMSSNRFSARLQGIEERQEYRDKCVLPILRAAFKESHNKNSKFYTEEVYNVLDWARIEKPEFDRNQRNAKWSWFLEQSRIWHEQEVIRRRIEYEQRMLNAEENERKRLKRKMETTWETLIPEITIDGYSVTALTSLLDTYQEGQTMKNCVGTESYAQSCVDGKTQLYSIKNNNGVNVATLQLKKEIDYIDKKSGSFYWDIPSQKPEFGTEKTIKWVVSQIYGPCNRMVSSDVDKAAKKLANKYTVLEKESNKKESRHTPELAKLEV